jgi:hypothetical protein
VDGTAFQQHQGSGRRAKRLRSNGHLVSFSGAAPYVAAAGQWINENANLVDSFRNATKRFQKAKEQNYPFQANGITLAAIKGANVMN